MIQLSLTITINFQVTDNAIKSKYYESFSAELNEIAVM